MDNDTDISVAAARYERDARSALADTLAPLATNAHRRHVTDLITDRVTVIAVRQRLSPVLGYSDVRSEAVALCYVASGWTARWEDAATMVDDLVSVAVQG